MTNSSVNQVLVTKGNQALAGSGTTVKDLLPGQLGFFDADTRLAIHNSTTAAKANNVLIAVGIDADGDTVTDRVKYQAGAAIQMQTKGYHKLVYQPASAGRAEIYRISDLKANCDTEYILKMNFDGPSIAEFSNTSYARKSYTVKTSCCSECATGCYQGSCTELAVKLRDELNNDVEKLFTAKLIDPATPADNTLTLSANVSAAATITLASAWTGGSGVFNVTFTTGGGAVVKAVTFTNASATITWTGNITTIATSATIDGTIADITTWSAANATLCPEIEITGNTRAIVTSCGLNYNYEKNRDVVFVPYLVAGFGCAGTVSQVQTYVGETGQSYDIKFMEQVNAGWRNGAGAYRVYENGVQKSFESLAENGVKYDMFWLAYPYSIESGERKANDLQTLLAVPEADTTTRDAIAALLVHIYPNKDTLANDVAAASATPSVVEPVVTDEDTDGIA